MEKIIIGVVTFREKFWQTPVFQKLCEERLKYCPEEIWTLFVYDNTDSVQWNILGEYVGQSGIDLQYKHDCNNSGISVAYNCIAHYAKENRFKYIIFFDQDTIIPSNFINKYKAIAGNGVQIAVPKVQINGHTASPTLFKNYRSHLIKNFNDDQILIKQHSCINSGLMINTDFFFKCGGYNKNLRLDFCDHEFIKRVGQFTKYLQIIPVTLQQDFSTDTNSLKNALFRYSLFLKDMSEYKKINKHDYRITIFVDLPHLLRLTLQYRSLKFIKQRFY